MSTFTFLRRHGRLSPLTARHDLPYHVVGSDLAGVVLRTGPGVNVWKPGEQVVAHCLSVELESADGHNDTMLDPEHRDPRVDVGIHARVRQPVPVDEPQADLRLALRQLPGGMAGQPPDRQGHDPPHDVKGLPAGPGQSGRHGHAELVPDVLRRLRRAGAGDIPVVVGGIIPPADARILRSEGVAAVFTPEDFDISAIVGRIVDEIRRARGLEPWSGRPALTMER
jgi:hypothetical protein